MACSWWKTYNSDSIKIKVVHKTSKRPYGLPNHMETYWFKSFSRWTVTDTLHKEGKTQKLIVLYSYILMES